MGLYLGNTKTTPIIKVGCTVDFIGADGTNAGASGLVPAPSATDNVNFLKGDGSWSNPDAKNINVLSSSGTVNLEDNSVNYINPTGNVTFTLPNVVDNTIFHQILVQVKLSTVYSINVSTIYFFNEESPDMSAVGDYNIIFEYDKAEQHWVCGVLSKGIAG